MNTDKLSPPWLKLGQRLISNGGRGPGRARIIDISDTDVAIEIGGHPSSAVKLPRRSLARLQTGWRPAPDDLPIAAIDPIGVANNIVGLGDQFTSIDAAVATFEAIENAIREIAAAYGLPLIDATAEEEAA